MTPYFDNGITRLYCADAREIPLPDESVHCAVTSPPYFGLRVYEGSGDNTLGLESTTEEYIESLVLVFRELPRVLRPDGVVWLNPGDSYEGSGKGWSRAKQRTNVGSFTGTKRQSQSQGKGLDLMGIPWRVVLALQADGWLHRRDHVWHKPSPMPESVNGTRWERHRVKLASGAVSRHGVARGVGYVNESDVGNRDFATGAQWKDCPGCPKCLPYDGYVLRHGSWRCTSSHEFVFMLVRNGGYYADGEAVQTPSVSDHPSGNGFQRSGRLSYENEYGTLRGQESPWKPSSSVNRRSVWSDIRPERYSGEHHAVFPSDLPRFCIQASTSEAGVCSGCGAQWARVVKREFVPQGDVSREKGIKGADGQKPMDASSRWYGFPRGSATTNTIGWRPTCKCDAGDPIPATVLDPFVGTGTTCLAAQRLGRRSVGVDLSGQYLSQAVNGGAAPDGPVRKPTTPAGGRLMVEQIGDGPIDPEYRKVMEATARGLDYVFNAGTEGLDRKTGWVLMVFPFGDAKGRCNYISNGNRDHIIELMGLQLKRFEAEAEAPGEQPVAGMEVEQPEALAIDDRVLAALYSEFSEETWRSGWYGSAQTTGSEKLPEKLAAKLLDVLGNRQRGWGS